jgi:hypothetical protein
MTAPNLLFVAQSGRLGYEAVILAASLRACDPDFSGRVFAAVPNPGPLWRADPRLPVPVRDLLVRFGVEVLSFDSRIWGQRYPQGNKIEALATLPEGEPFLFLDTDTLVTGPLSQVPFDFARPAASMRREATWPDPPLYGPGYGAIWQSLYDRFGLNFATSMDPAFAEDDWRRYLYFNAGWFFGACPRRFGERFAAYAARIERDPPEALAAQSLDPWLDQVTLPLVIHGLGGGRPGTELDGLDGGVTCHYRALPLLYARESDRAVEVLETVLAPNPIKKVLRDHDPVRRLVYQRKGRDLRDMFDRNALPLREAVIRNRIRAAGLWLR